MIRGTVNPPHEADMPRPRPPHLHREISRHGKATWYVRVGKGPRVRIREEFGTPEFMAAYHAAVAGEQAPKKAGVKSGSLSWLIDAYRKSAGWTALSLGTRKARENIFKRMIMSAGGEPYSGVSRRDIVEARDRRTPFAGANFLKATRALFAWAVEAEYLDENPCDGVKALSLKTDGHHVWTEDEIARFEKRWPIGSRERLAFALLLFTGLRRGDVVRLGKQHVRNGVIEIRTEKTSTPVFVPILPDLQKTIDRSRSGDLHFLVTEFGKPFTSAGFGNWFRESCKKAGVPGSAHGLRKAAATRLANAGATVHELESIFGWEGGKMASHYTKQADRARLARSAMDKMQTSIPAPSPQVRAVGQKNEQ